jgi:hypothetical protein
VLSNQDSYSQKFQHVAPDFVGYHPYVWDSTRSGIGWDWKFFDGSAYSVVDSMIFFVKTLHGDVYKLVFTKYEGGSTGKIVFKKAKIAGLGIGKTGKNDSFIISPNPASDHLTIAFLSPLSESASLEIADLTGKMVYRQTLGKGSGNTIINTSRFNNGLYFIRITSPSVSSSGKVIIER